MEFFIKKNATLPVLKINVIKDGRSDYNRSMKFLSETDVFFSMVDTETNIPRITTRPAGLMSKLGVSGVSTSDYYVYYQFTPFDTKKVGRYKGQFLFRDDTGVLVLPLNEEIYINVTDSFILNDSEFQSCYVVDYPCCSSFTPPIPPVPPGPSTTSTTSPTTTSTTSPITTTTSTTPLTGATAWTVAQPVTDGRYFCDRDATPYVTIYTQASLTLYTGLQLFNDVNLTSPVDYFLNTNFITVLARDGVDLTERYSFTISRSTSQNIVSEYVYNILYCNETVPCRELTITRNGGFPLVRWFDCNARLAGQQIGVGQTVTICGSFPIGGTGHVTTIGPNC